MSPVWRRRALWSVLALVLVAGSAAAFVQAGRVRDRMIADATDSGRALVEVALVPELTGADALVPATGTRYEQIAGAVDRQILADGTIRSVTIWSPDGTILFADDTRLVGQQVRAMRVPILGVIGGQARSDLLRDGVRTLVPVPLAEGASVAVELDRDAEPVRSATDPWRLMGLIGAAGALLAGLLLARSLTRIGRRAEGFDEDALRAALSQRRRAEHDRQESEERRSRIEGELEHARSALRDSQAELRRAERDAADLPALRERLEAAAEEARRGEEARSALEAHVEELRASVDAEAAKGREEVAAALAEVARLEATRATLQDRTAKAEDAVTHLTEQVETLRADPGSEAELEAARADADSARRGSQEQRERADRAERRAVELETRVAELTAALREHERRPDLSAKLEAATQALEIGREQIRALTVKLDESDRALTERTTELERAREEIEVVRGELEVVRGELLATAAELASTRTQADTYEDEATSLHRQADAAGAVIAGANSELMRAAEEVRALTARVEAAEAARAELEVRLVESEERARRAEATLAGAEAMLAGAETTVAEGDAGPGADGASEPRAGAERLTVSVSPDGPAVALHHAVAAPEPNGSRARPSERIEVDTLVRRVVQDAWSNRGRSVSVYAEPVIVEADRSGVARIVDVLLATSINRTGEGGRVVVQVEWVDHGALLSVDDGQPAKEEEMSPEVRALAEERGGWARVDVGPDGEGVFRVWLPQTISVPAPTRASTAGRG